MKTLSTLLFVLGTILLQAQVNLPNSSFKFLSTIPCPFDTSIEVVQPDYWRLYQTLDGKWDGPIDSAICISVEPLFSWGAIRIDLNQIDPARPLFMRCLLDDSNKIALDSNWVYLANGGMAPVGATQLDPSNQCTDDLCTGIIVGVEIPDESGDSSQLRTYIGPFEEFIYGSYVTCIPTEYFPENYLKEFIFKVKVDTANIPPENFAVRIYSASTEMIYWVGHIYEVNANEFQWTGQSYEIYVGDLAFDGWQNFLFMYGDTTYPSLDHPYFIDAVPQENSPEPKIINIHIYDFESAYFQPFTYLRGGLVESSDSVRHIVNLVNSGGNICVNFIELIFEKNTNYIHHGGQLEFSGKSGCLQFRDGSSLVVADSATLQYGHNGHGMLALRTGGTIEIGKDGTLLIDNTLALFPYHSNPADPESRQVYMELNPGSTLAFGEHARIMRKFNPENDMRLNIYMNGGILDDSKLPPEDRLLINRIYPAPSPKIADNIQLSPNPATNLLECRYLSQGNTEVQIEIFNSQGQLVLVVKRQTEKGLNFFNIPVTDLSAGWYALRISDPTQGSATKPWLKL